MFQLLGAGAEKFSYASTGTISPALWLICLGKAEGFDIYLPHQLEIKGNFRSLMPRSEGIFMSHVLQTRAEHFQ